MKHVTMTVVTREDVSHVTCDICGKPFTTTINDDMACRTEHEFEISYEYSEYCYEPVDSYHWRPDICMECFVKHFIPFFKLLGLTPPLPRSKYDATFETAINNYQRNKERFMKEAQLPE